MADQHTMAELLRAPTEGYAEAIVVPPILAEQFELKHSLINMMNSDQYKDLLRACPHHGFTELHQLDTFYNVINPTDQDSLNSATGGNLLERRTQDMLTIIENKYKVRNSRKKSVVSKVKSYDANSNSSSEIAKLTHKCLAAGGNTFPEHRDNIQGYVSASAFNYNQGNSVYRPPGSGSLPSNTVANPKGEIKDISTRSGIVLDGPSILIPPKIYPHLHVNPLSTSSSPSHLLEEFVDELALITFHLEYDDDLQFDIVSNLKEIEYLLHHDPIKDTDSILKDLIDQNNLADLNENFVNSVPEMFTNEHALDYSSPLLFDEYDDDVESDTENVYDDPFDSKGEKIKESKLLIDELDLPCDFLPPFEYDSFISKDFSKVDALPSANNEDKVFNPCILIQENPFEIITRVAKDKKLAISHASLMIENFDPPLYELPFFKEVPRSRILLPFSFENEEKVFKPQIHTSKKVHSSLITELSHQSYKVFKINQNLKTLMKIFLFSYGRIPTSWMSLVSTFTPLISSSMGNCVKLSDLKQALRGRHPMLILSF
uniref:Reverse transcriptase domain-containing protein n=1 Tax=Tanacetum cinerariifolium TaxID=118510 RepID=A0A6L2MR97_TANCI|nr:reverse transcriptase domain-containing protein [Tanacetum cinerariifolium]